MKQKEFGNIIIIFLVIIALVGIFYLIYISKDIVTYNTIKNNQQQNTPHPTSLPTPSPFSSSDTTKIATKKVITNPDCIEGYLLEIETPGWYNLKSEMLGISFDYPVMDIGEISFCYTKNLAFAWSYHPTVIKNGVGGFSIAGAVSKENLFEDWWYTNFYQLHESDYKNAIATYKTKFKSDLVFKNASDSRERYEDDVILLTNIPYKKNDVFKGLAIYSMNKLTDEDVIRIVNSISLN